MHCHSHLSPQRLGQHQHVPRHGIVWPGQTAARVIILTITTVSSSSRKKPRKGRGGILTWWTHWAGTRLWPLPPWRPRGWVPSVPLLLMCLPPPMRLWTPGWLMASLCPSPVTVGEDRGGGGNGKKEGIEKVGHLQPKLKYFNLKFNLNLTI